MQIKTNANFKDYGTWISKIKVFCEKKDTHFDSKRAN